VLAVLPELCPQLVGEQAQGLRSLEQLLSRPQAAARQNGWRRDNVASANRLSETGLGGAQERSTRTSG